MSNPESDTLPADAPPGFHLLAKPSGSTCNIDCTYCFFLSKDALYPNEKHRMSAATLEAYIRQLLESHSAPEVTVAWQGGEPTLMKPEFFRHSVELVEKYRRPGQVVKHTFQTNGILLDDEWCTFFKEHDFLVGLSVDGPRELHDTYRLDRRKKGTFDRVMQGWRQLRKHGVEFNILCTVNAANEKHGRDVYRFFRDELGAKWVQFIPIVERATQETLAIANQGWSEPSSGGKRLLYTQTGNLVTERTVGARQYGQFLVDVFEEWVRHDVGEVYVQLFDVTLEAFFGRHLLVHPCAHLRLRPGARVQRRSVFLRSFRRAALQARQHPQDAHAEAGGLAGAAQVRRGQARVAHRPVPQLQGQELVQRRLSEGPLRAVARRRAGAELPVRGPGAVFHAYRPDVQHHGQTDPARPRACGNHGGDRSRRLPARTLSALPLRQRTRNSASATVIARRRKNGARPCRSMPIARVNLT